MLRIHLLRVLLLAAICLAPMLPAREASARAEMTTNTAATLLWTGTLSADWNAAGNWTISDPQGTPARVPENGDTLVFAGSAANKTLNNSISNLHLAGITFSAGGYSLAGQAVTLEGQILMNEGATTVSNTIALDLVIGSAQQVVDVLSPNTLHLCGVLRGTGDLTKRGTGDLRLCGSLPNIYSGKVTVEAGSVILNKSANQVAITGLVDLLEGANEAAPNQLITRSSGQFGPSAAIKLAKNSIFSLRGTTQSLWKISGEYGTLALDEPADTPGSLTLNPLDLEINEYNHGILSGRGQILVKSTGEGTQGFGYNSAQAAGLFSGSLAVSGKADFSLPNFHTAGPVIVHSGEASLFYQSQFSAVSVENGTLEVQPADTAANYFTQLDGLTLTSTSTLYFGLYSAHAQYLVVKGPIALGSAKLSLNYASATFPLPGVAYVLIKKDAVGPLLGTFKNAPQGARIEGREFYSITPRGFLINYAGNDGNDVTLTRLAKSTLQIIPQVTTAKFGTEVPLTARLTPSETNPPALPIGSPVNFFCAGRFAGSSALADAGGGVAQAQITLSWKLTRVGPVSCLAEFPYTSLYDKVVSATTTITFSGERSLLPLIVR
jgi:autotransporter-associated beta strand protein